MYGLLVFVAIVIAIIVYNARRKKSITAFVLPANAGEILESHVNFYKELSATDKKVFEERVRDFLARTAVNGVEIQVTDTDRLLVAASAIIPIFSFPDWRYNNISEVLLYKGTFDTNYKTKGSARNVLGMVGSGAMHGQMILSQPALIGGFLNPTDGRNTAIHEFVHLIDKADGSVDGVPEYLMSTPAIEPWLKNIHTTIAQMKAKGRSDINLYGATNEAEFFAVVSEYFFERPKELQEKHPELYEALEQMFKPKTA